MAELAKLDGDKIDDGAMKLLNSGLQLTNEDWQELANTYKDNHVMTRILKARYDANRPKSEGDGLTLGQKNNDLTFVQFGQSPQDRAENFSKFTDLIQHSCVSGTVLREYADRESYWNSIAKNSIGKMQPFADEDFESVNEDFPVTYQAPKFDLW